MLEYLIHIVRSHCTFISYMRSIYQLFSDLLYPRKNILYLRSYAM